MSNVHCLSGSIHLECAAGWGWDTQRVYGHCQEGFQRSILFIKIKSSVTVLPLFIQTAHLSTHCICISFYTYIYLGGGFMVVVLHVDSWFCFIIFSFLCVFSSLCEDFCSSNFRDFIRISALFKSLSSSSTSSSSSSSSSVLLLSSNISSIFSSSSLK